MSAHILVIEDNTDIRENIIEILELAGYEVSEASNGKEGVKKTLEGLPDLVLCDVMMPVMDGYQTLFTLSQNSKTRDIPFVFLTAKSEKEDWRKGMNLGADDYLVKPFEEVELLGVIQTRLIKKEHLTGKVSKANKQLTLDELLSKGTVRKFKKKEVVYREGDFANRIYQLKSGKIRGFKRHLEGKELSTSFFNESEFFGLSSVLSDSEYSYSAVVLDDCTVLQFSKEDFLNSVFESRELSESFLKILSEEVSLKEESLLKLAYNSVRKRVADSLLELKNKYAQNEDEEFVIKISRDNLASMVGTSPESVIRVLHDFKEENLITSKGREIKVINAAGLKTVIA